MKVPPKVLWRIVADLQEDGLYLLLDEDDVIQIMDRSTRRLSDWAFDNGADEVRHSYDLVAYEERCRR